MKQLFSFLTLGGNPTSGHFGNFMAGSEEMDSPVESSRSSINLVDGVLRNLTLSISVAPGTGEARTFTLRQNGADTAVALTFSNAETTKRYSGADLAIADGDVLSLKGTFTGSPALFSLLGTQFEIESSAPKQSQYHQSVWGSNSIGAPVVTRGIFHNGAGAGVCPTDGTLTKLSIYGSTNAGVMMHVLCLVLNGVDQDGTGGTVDTAITISTAGAISQTKTFVLPVVAGDIVAQKMVSTSGATQISTSVRLEATIDGESVLAISPPPNLSTGVTDYYLPVDSDGFNAFTTESTRQLAGGVTTAAYRNLWAILSGPPGSGKSHAFTLRRNGVSMPLTVSIADATTSATDLDATHTFSIADGDAFSLQHTPSGTPAAVTFQLAFVQYIGVPVIACTTVFTELWVDEDPDIEVSPGSCVGGGTVASGTTPTDGASLSTSTAPLVYAHIHLASSPETILRIAGLWIPHGDPKAPYVLKWGQVERALGDSDGGPQASTQEILLFDRNGDIRAARRDDTLRNAVVDVFVADLATVQADGTPFRVNRGFISKCRPEGDRTFRITLTDVLTTRLNNIDGEDQQMPSLLIDDTIAGLASTAEAFGKPACDLYGSISGTGGAWQCPYVGTAVYPDRAELGPLSWFLVGPGVVTIRTIWLASLSALNPNQRVQVPESAIGTYIFRPEDLTGASPAPKYFTFGDRRWTLIAALSGSPAIKLAREGTIPMLVEVCGYETVGDGSGATIDSPARALLHWMNNRLLQDATDDWLPIAEDGGIDLFDTESFEHVHTVLNALAYAVSPTIAGAVGFDGQQNWRDIIASWCRQFGFDLAGANRHGQVMAVVLDTTDEASDAPLFDESTILEGSVVPDDGTLQTENVERFVYRRRYDDPLPSLTPQQDARLPNDPFKAAWLSGEQNVQDDPSIAALGGGTRGLRRSQVQEYSLVRDEATANLSATARLDLLSPQNGRLEGAVGLSLRHGCDLELGDIVQLKHWDLNWTGYRRCQIRRLVWDLDALTISVGWRDVDDLLP